MKTSVIVSLACLLFCQASGQPVWVEIPFPVKRQWIGKPETAQFQLLSLQTGYSSPVAAKARFDSPKGPVTTSTSNFHRNDVEWMTHLMEWAYHKNSAAPAPTGHIIPRQVPLDRRLIAANYPGYEEYPGHISGAMAPFFLWWDQSGLIELDSRKDDAQSKRDEAMKILDRAVSRKLQSRGLDGCVEGLYDAADKIHDNPIGFSSREINYLGPDFLSYYTREDNATLLWMTVYLDGELHYNALTSLCEADENGGMTLVFRGVELKVQLTEIDPNEKIDDFDHDGSYELKILNRQVLDPDYAPGKEVKLFLKAGHSELWVIKPYLFKPGTKHTASTPKIPPYDFSNYRSDVPVEPQKMIPIGPFNFEAYKQSLTAPEIKSFEPPPANNRQWTDNENRKLKGYLASDRKIRTLKGIFDISPDSLSRSDRNYLEFHSPEIASNRISGRADQTSEGKLIYELSAAEEVKHRIELNFSENQLIAYINNAYEDHENNPNKAKNRILIDFEKQCFEVRLKTYKKFVGGRFSRDFIAPEFDPKGVVSTDYANRWSFKQGQESPRPTWVVHKGYPCQQMTNLKNAKITKSGQQVAFISPALDGTIRYARMKAHPVQLFWRVLADETMSAEFFTKKLEGYHELLNAFYHYNRIPMAIDAKHIVARERNLPALARKLDWQLQLVELDLLVSGPGTFEFSPKTLACKAGGLVEFPDL